MYTYATRCITFAAIVQTRIDEEIAVFRKENNELIKTSCEAQVLWTVRCSIAISECVCFMQARELVAEFRHSTGSSKLSLPLKDTELDARSSPPRKKTWTTLKFLFIID